LLHERLLQKLPGLQMQMFVLRGLLARLQMPEQQIAGCSFTGRNLPTAMLVGVK